jgi:hypothetical protein
MWSPASLSTSASAATISSSSVAMLVLDELDGPEEAGAADVADDGQGPQLAEARRGTRAERKFLADVRAGLFTSYRS